MSKDLHCAVDLGQISVGDHLRWLVADTNLKPSRTPVDELDGALGLENSDGAVHIFCNNVAAVEQAGSHVFAIARITLHHLVVWLEARHRDLLDRVGFVRGLGSRDDRSVGNEREMDTGVGHQVSLEFVKIDVEGTVEAERGSD